MSDSLWPHGLQPARLLCPWDSPSKNNGMHCHFLLQRSYHTGTGPRSPALWADSFFIIWVTLPLTVWMLPISWLLQSTWKAFFSKAFLELLHHMLTTTDSEFYLALTVFFFFSVFIVLNINHLKQTVSSWKLKMNLFIFPLHLMSLFLTHWRAITWLQKVLIDLLS